MASDVEFVEYVVGQLNGLREIRYKKMFGEFALYYKEKLVALVCDNQLFVKSSKMGREFLKDVREEAPYPGAKPSFLIDMLENSEVLCELIEITWLELPVRKAKNIKGATL